MKESIWIYFCELCSIVHKEPTHCPNCEGRDHKNTHSVSELLQELLAIKRKLEIE